MKNGLRLPEFSVIIPTFNRAAFLRRAIVSVLTQDFPNWELIVVDDGSTDETAEMLRGYDDARLKVLTNDVNRERSYSRNRGIKEARGRFICFLDSDDEWLPCHLQVHADCWGGADAGVGCVISQFARLKEGEREAHPLPPLWSDRSFAEYILKNQPAIHTVSLRRNVLTQFIFDTRLNVNEDVVLLTKIAARCGVVVIPNCTALYRSHAGNTHGVNKNTLSVQLRAMKTLFADSQVRKCIGREVRIGKFRDLRHLTCYHFYRNHSSWCAAAYIAYFLIRYPFHWHRRSKVIMLLSKIPFIGRLEIVKRSADAVVRNYY